MNYVLPELGEWNEVIAGHFFRDSERGRDVTLCVNAELVCKLFEGCGVRDLVRVIEDECLYQPHSHRNPLSLGVSLRDQWRRGGCLGFPPYLAIVGLLILAGEYGDVGIPDHVYWERLELLRQAHAPDCDKIGADRKFIESLFCDLAYWSCVQKAGRLGCFELRRLGKQRFVGLIRSQLLLAADDRAKLKSEFWKQGVSPAQLPSRAELVAIARSIQAALRPAARQLLEQWPSTAISEALVDELEEFLLRWDGVVSGQSEEGEAASSPLLPAFLEFRLTDGRLQPVIRLDTAGWSLPDQVVLSDAKGSEFFASFDAGRLSIPISSEPDGRPVDASLVDWSHGLRLTSSSDHLRGAALPARSVRFFVLEHRVWVEESMLPVSGTCLIATDAAWRDPLLCWSKRWTHEGSWKEIGTAVLPQGWRLYRVDHIPEDPASRQAFPCPGFVASESPSIQLLGGITSSNGAYLSFGLPAARVRGGRSDMCITLAGAYDTDGKMVRGVALGELPTEGGNRIWQLGATESLWNRLAIVQIQLIDAANRVQATRTVRVELGEATGSADILRDLWGRAMERQSPNIGIEGFRGPGSDGSFQPKGPVGRPMRPSDEMSCADRFVQVLASRAAMRWSEARLVARSMSDELGGYEAWKASRSVSLQFEAMRALGRIEITENVDGHFHEVRSIPPVLHLLETRVNVEFAGGRFPLQAILAGTCSGRQLAALLAAARDLKIEVNVERQPEGYWLVPDKLSLLAYREDDLRTLARAVGWALLTTPFSAVAAQTLLSPESFLDVADWRVGPPPHASNRLAFDVTTGRSRPEQHVHDDVVLLECREPYGIGRWSYWLHDRNGNRHAPCPRQLGRWIIAVKSRHGPRMLAASATGDLFFPLELRPPLLVERALCACSGLAPTLTTFTADAANWQAMGYSPPPSRRAEWLTDSAVNSGHWLCYTRIRNSSLIARRNEDEDVFVPLGLPIAQVRTLRCSQSEF